MFSRRKASSTAPSNGATASTSSGVTTGEVNPYQAKKGRPTPTRREAEAAAKARAKALLDPKASRKQQRQFQVEKSRNIRQAMKAGDERYLPARDKGPVRRFIRDYVDARLSVAEFAMPLLVASLIASVSGYYEIGNGIINATLLLVVVDSAILRFRMRRELSRRFPDESLKRTTWYAFMRALQLRFMRLPKPNVKLGQALPEHYR